MGWDWEYGQTVKGLKAELNASAERNGTKVLAQATKGNVWYRAMENSKGEKFVAVYLIGRSKDAAGYKAMSEDEHPFYYDCPLKILLAAPRFIGTISKSAADWRRNVNKYHELVAAGVAPRHAHARCAHEAINQPINPEASA